MLSHDLVLIESIKTPHLWVLIVPLDIQGKLLITNHLEEGEENQKVAVWLKYTSQTHFPK